MPKVVFTETSKYLIDTIENVIYRHPGEGLGDYPDTEFPAICRELRKDGEAIELLEVLQLQVGLPMKLMLQIRDDGVSTYRETTIVHKVLEA